jgi:hypothetical protein
VNSSNSDVKLLNTFSLVGQPSLSPMLAVSLASSTLAAREIPLGTQKVSYQTAISQSLQDNPTILTGTQSSAIIRPAGLVGYVRPKIIRPGQAGAFPSSASSPNLRTLAAGSGGSAQFLVDKTTGQITSIVTAPTVHGQMNQSDDSRFRKITTVATGLSQVFIVYYYLIYSVAV